MPSAPPSAAVLPSWTLPWRRVLAPWLATRALLFVFAWISLIVLAPDASPEHWRVFPDWPALDGWSRWDSGWYASIILKGYYFTPGEPCNVNFFPLYSWIAGLVSLPLRLLTTADRAFHIGGVLVSLSAFWCALAGLWRLGTPLWGDDKARRAAWLIACFPFSLFFSAVYTESLFLALSVWAFVFGLERRWALASLFIGLSALTRVTGPVVGLALGIEFAFAHWGDRQRWRRDAPWLLASAVPLLTLMTWFHVRFGNAFVVMHTYTKVWDKKPGLRPLIDVLNSIRSSSEPVATRFQNLLYVLVLFGSLALVLRARKHLTPGLIAYAVASVGIVAFTGFTSAGRYTAVLFPAFGAASVLLGPRSWRVVAVVSMALCLWFTLDFSHWWLVT